MNFSSQVPQQITDVSPSIASGDVPSEGAIVSQDTNLPSKGVNASQSDRDTNPPPEGASVLQSERDTDIPPEGTSASQSEHDTNLLPTEVHESSPEDVAQNIENDCVLSNLEPENKGAYSKMFCM